MRVTARVAAMFGLVVAFGVTAGTAFADLPPVVTVGAPSGVSYTSAHVSGTVDPEGGPSPVSWHFEYSSEPGNEFAWNYAFLANGEISGVEAEGTAPIPVEGDLESLEEFPGLAPGTEYSVRLVAENEFGANRVVTPEPYPQFTTKPVGLAAVSIAAPSSVTGSTAHFSGEIDPGAPAGNPQAFDVNWRFECAPECPGLTGATIPADSAAHTVETDASGLLHNTEYEVKLIASNAGGETSVSQTFKTETVAPEPESRPVGTRTSSTAIIGGSVDPNGSATTYWIEYADNGGFTGAMSIPATQDAPAGEGQTPVIVSQLLTGLEPNSSYFFRITAKSQVATVNSATQTFHTRAGESPEGCANEQLRNEDNSTSLPDCRAYELVTPDSNHATLGGSAGMAAPSGDTMVYLTGDAPQNANSAAVANFDRTTRDAATGWSGVSLSPRLSTPINAYLGLAVSAISADLSSTFVLSDQPLTAGPLPGGQNMFVGRADGTYRLVNLVGAPFVPALGTYRAGFVLAGTPDFGHIYIEPRNAQGPTDPTAENTVYSWSEEEGLQLLGILPDGTPAQNGEGLAGYGLPAVSTDGKQVAFTADEKLYLRTDESHTVEAGASQRTVNPDPNAPTQPNAVGVTANGSEVLFTSPSELTEDANTGESGGVATDAGRDLYSYDTATGTLTDLTVDTNPADAATGANVLMQQNGPIVAASADGSYIYFLATGTLAPGAIPGHKSLYVWHEGQIVLVADAENLYVTNDTGLFPLTPDGRHVAFVSTDSLTGYDNTDPKTGQPHLEVFEASFGGGIECASCRANGTRPTGDSTLPTGGIGPIRVMSDDGSRLFFHSKDAVVPRASSGLQQVFEYAGGKASAISPLDGPSAAFPTNSAVFLDTSASGNDVFFETFGEILPNANGRDDAVYDARVDGGFPVVSRPECAGVACRGASSSAPLLDALPSTSSSGPGNLVSPKAVAKRKTAAQRRAAKLAKTLRACKKKKPKRKRLTCEKHARKSFRRSK